MLSFRASCSQVILKVFLGRKTTRKVRAVEVPFGGSKHENTSSALKSAIHVKILLNDLFKLIKGTFYSLGLVLSDLKGGRGSTFCVADFALITAFLSVDSPQLQGPKVDQNHGSGPNSALNAPISCVVFQHPAPRGARVSGAVLLDIFDKI